MNELATRPMRARRLVALATAPSSCSPAWASRHGAGDHKPPRTLAVSVPPDVTPITPGHTATIPVRIVNAGSAAIVVKMSERGDRAPATTASARDRDRAPTRAGADG